MLWEGIGAYNKTHYVEIFRSSPKQSIQEGYYAVGFRQKSK